MHVPHALADDVVDIGMYVDPVLRRRGVGQLDPGPHGPPDVLVAGTYAGGRLLVEELGLAGRPSRPPA